MWLTRDVSIGVCFPVWVRLVHLSVRRRVSLYVFFAPTFFLAFAMTGRLPMRVLLFRRYNLYY